MTDIKSGAVHWVKVGRGVGYEQSGKGRDFTRPALVLDLFGDHYALIVLISSRRKRGQYYRTIVIGGQKETLLINQFRVVDKTRVGDFIDEISGDALMYFRETIADLIKNPPKRKNLA